MTHAQAIRQRGLREFVPFTNCPNVAAYCRRFSRGSTHAQSIASRDIARNPKSANRLQHIFRKAIIFLDAYIPQGYSLPVMLSRKKLSELRRTSTGEPNKLKLAMKLAGVTQGVVSERIGISQSQVSEDATGLYSEMSLDKARKYADLFGCAVDDLFPRQKVAA